MEAKERLMETEREVRKLTEQELHDHTEGAEMMRRVELSKRGVCPECGGSLVEIEPDGRFSNYEDKTEFYQCDSCPTKTEDGESISPYVFILSPGAECEEF